MEIEIDMASRELTKQKQLSGHQREHYSVANLSTEVIRMETGLPTKEVFHITVNYVAKLLWKIKCSWALSIRPKIPE